jgi:hypothetical protein
MQPTKRRKINTSPLKVYARYSSIAFQMMAIIIAGVFGGIKLDAWLNLGFPVFTILLSMISVFFAIYFVIRDLLK